MAPELVPLAAPVPLPSWFEWAKLIVPPIITGLVVLTGAYITYIFANKGRKEDILYKERYKGFEEMTGYMYSVSDMCLSYLNELSKFYGPLTPVIPHYILKIYCEELIFDIRKLRPDKPSNKYLTLQSTDAVDRYFNVSDTLTDLQSSAYAILDFPESQMRDDAHRDSRLEYLVVLLKEIRSDCDYVIDTSLKHLDLPKR